jgi:gas vesicle protein GvpN
VAVDRSRRGVARIQPAGDRVIPEPSAEFVLTPYVREITERALTYLETGYPVHFAGPAGTGKTTLAFHVAAKLGRPVSLIHGDDEFGSSDLVGRDTGYRKSKLIDNFIRSVVRTEEEMKTIWVDNRLTGACQNGYTLIYDEFNRSRPETNNVFLSVLAEGVLNLPSLRCSGEGYMKAHPDFRCIFTSNPEEYAGVHKAQDALLDRLITIHLSHYDRETEVEITMARSGVPRASAARIVDIVREVRSIGVSNQRPTIRACVAIARILAGRGARTSREDPIFRLVARDVLLGSDTIKVTRGGQSLMRQKIDEVIAGLTDPGFDEPGPSGKTEDPIHGDREKGES